MVELASSSAAVARRSRETIEPPPERHDDSQIDLGPYAAALWRRRWVLAALAVVFGTVAFINAIRTVRLYEAMTFLTVGYSKLTTDTGAAPSTAGLRPLVASRTVAGPVVEEFKLHQPPYNYSVSSFLEKAVQVDEVRNTGVMRLSVRLRDPDSAARVANALASRAVHFAESLSQQESVRVKDLIKAELDAAKARLDKADAALVASQRKAQLEVRRADLYAQLAQRDELPTLITAIEAKKAEIALGEQELAKRSRMDTVVRRIEQEPALLEAARERIASPNGVLGLEMKAQELNEVYSAIDQRLAHNRAELAGLERKRAEVLNAQRPTAAQMGRLQELYELEGQVTRLELEQKLAADSYEEIAKRFEGARLQVASRSVELQVLDPATPPDRPLSRQVVRRTATGLFIGLLLAAAVVLALSFVQGRPKAA